MSRNVSAPPRRLAAAALAATLGLVAAGCGSQAKVSGTVVKDAQGCVDEVAHRDEAPKINAGIEVGEKPSSKDLIEGKKGCSPTGAEYLSLDLVGATAADGEVFTSTWETDRPVTAQIGVGALLPGLEASLVDVKVGDRRQITVPAAQAYGADGNPDQGIGPNQDLVFVVDLLSLTPKPRFCAAATGVPTEVDGKPIEGKPDIENPREVPVGDVITRDIKEGDGATVTKTSYVTVNYVGISCATGKQFDASWDRGEPASFSLAPGPEGGVIAGWTDGLEGAKAGGVRELDIPSQLAYGARGTPDGTLGPDEALTFVIEIISVAKKAPKTTTTVPDDAELPTTSLPRGEATTTPRAVPGTIQDGTTTTEG